MFGAINGMMLDMLAAVARKDYDDRRRRQAQGIAKAKAKGKYRGRPENVDRNAGIAAQLRGGASPSYSRRSSIWCLRGFWDLGAHGFVRLFVVRHGFETPGCACSGGQG